MSNYEDRHPNDMVLHPLSEIREWDEALAVLGYTIHQIAAWSGHKSLREVERYTKAADQRRMARDAMGNKK